MARTFFCSLTMLALFAVLAKADDSKSKTDKDNHMAKITKVDAKKGTMTVTMKDQNGKDAERTLQLADSAKYFDSDGKTIKSDAFQSGDHVLVTEKDGKVTELKKATQHTDAKITKVDPKNGTISVMLKDENGKSVEKTFYLVEDAEYIDDAGNVGTLDVFQSGDDVLFIEAEGKIKQMTKDTTKTKSADIKKSADTKK